LRPPYFIALLFVASSKLLCGAPSSAQIASDAASFHKFRLTTLAAAAQVSAHNPGSNLGADYIAGECRKLARRTTPDYLFGVFYDLSQDTSRTEDSFLIGECLTMAYPPDQAIKVLREIKSSDLYNPNEIQAWIEDVQQSEKAETSPGAITPQ
jgi:hypothetical protein